MKVSLNHYTNNLLVEAMEYLHNKYVTKEQYAQNKDKPKTS